MFATPHARESFQAVCSHLETATSRRMAHASSTTRSTCRPDAALRRTADCSQADAQAIRIPRAGDP